MSSLKNHKQGKSSWSLKILWIIGTIVVFIGGFLLIYPTPNSNANQSEVNTVHIKGVDFAYAAPDKIESGWTRFHFTNEGKEAHHLTIVRLEGERTLADFVNDFKSGETKGKYTALGGPNGVGPGGQSEATVFLKPGQYALLCFIPSPDGKLHLMKGMLKPFEVTGKQNGASEPSFNSEMTLLDYEFDVSQPLYAGKQAIRVTNGSSDHLHEVLLAQLKEGVSVEEVVHWMEHLDGPPPANFLGGVSALHPGESNIFHVTLDPGRYAWICPMVEAPGQLPHTAHGMMEEFTVSR